MRLYRICRDRYARDYSGKGAALYGGRWNSKGYNALYAAQTVSLAILEALVHLNQAPPSPYSLITFDLDSRYVSELEKADSLPATLGMHTMALTRFIGDRFLLGHQAVGLRVPSIVHQHEHNYLLNPAHDNFAALKVVRVEPFVFDTRLFL